MFLREGLRGPFEEVFLLCPFKVCCGVAWSAQTRKILKNQFAFANRIYYAHKRHILFDIIQANPRSRLALTGPQEWWSNNSVLWRTFSGSFARKCVRPSVSFALSTAPNAAVKWWVKWLFSCYCFYTHAFLLLQSSTDWVQGLYRHKLATPALSNPQKGDRVKPWSCTTCDTRYNWTMYANLNVRTPYKKIGSARLTRRADIH